MAADIASRSETRGQIIKLTRFAILGTLGLAFLLLLADFLGRGWNNEGLRFLSENVLTGIVYAIALETVAAIIALVCLALWKE
jgi:multisubunit Na+/H+ antiporter MnhB subunit